MGGRTHPSRRAGAQSPPETGSRAPGATPAAYAIPQAALPQSPTAQGLASPVASQSRAQHRDLGRPLDALVPDRRAFVRGGTLRHPGLAASRNRGNCLPTRHAGGL